MPHPEFIIINTFINSFYPGVDEPLSPDTSSAGKTTPSATPGYRLDAVLMYALDAIILYSGQGIVQLSLELDLKFAFIGPNGLLANDIWAFSLNDQQWYWFSGSSNTSAAVPLLVEIASKISNQVAAYPAGR